MKRFLISFAASTALFAAAAHACPQQTANNSAALSSGKIILAQATGNGNSAGTGGASGSTRPKEPSPLNGFNAPAAGSTADKPMEPAPGAGTAESTPGSNNAGSGGASGDSGPIDPRKTPPNGPTL